MICRQCGTEIADKALICYRCGTATTEPKIAPPPMTRGPASSPSLVPLVLSLVLFAVLVASAPAMMAYGLPRAGVIGVLAVCAAAIAWTILRRVRRR